MSGTRFSHVIGIDDAPFPRDFRGDIPIVGVAFSELRVEGVLRSKVRRDGQNATRALVSMIRESRFAPQTRLVMMEGIALGGFNVVDIKALSEALEMAVLVVSKRKPNMAAVEAALKQRVRGGEEKWRLIERAGPMEPLGSLFVQRENLSRADADAVIRRLAVSVRLPEPVRMAHIVASALAIAR